MHLVLQLVLNPHQPKWAQLEPTKLNWLVVGYLEMVVGYFEMVVGIGLQAFAVVDEAGEDDDAQHEEEDEQRQFFSRRFERVDEDLQTGRMARQLEQPQDADDGEKFQDISVAHVMHQLLGEWKSRNNLWLKVECGFWIMMKFDL